MNFDFINTITLLGFVQGLILATVLYKGIGKNKAANKRLALLLVLLSIMFLTRVLLLKYPSVLVFQRVLFCEPVIFLFGPLIYRYLRVLLKVAPAVDLNPTVFMPAIFYTGFAIYANILSVEVFRDKLINGDFTLAFFIVEGAALAQASYYFVRSNTLIVKYNDQEKGQLSFNQTPIKFAKVSNYLIGVVLVFWLVGFVGTSFFEISSFAASYHFIWIGLPLLVYLIGYYALKQPEIFRLQEAIPVKQEESRSYQRLQKEEIQALQVQLNTLIEKEKLYLDNEITLAAMAKKLKTSPNNLSWLLNKVYGSTFYDFINELRIKEFIQKVKDKEHVNSTLLALSLEVGFNSKSTFNKAFKSFQHETPTSFIKRMSK
ncbi:MAG: AraC family transcriptional regulator [Bacteroidota bacterium]